MSDGATLAQNVLEARQAVFDAYNKWKETEKKAAKAEAEYQAAKAIRYLELRAGGHGATDTNNIIKGDEQVNGYLKARECARADADTDKELIQICKLDLRCIEAQYEREWGFAGKDIL